MECKIQEVSEKLKIPKSTIRFWETEFPELVRPKRTNGRQRRYSEEDVVRLRPWHKEPFNRASLSLNTLSFNIRNTFIIYPFL